MDFINFLDVFHEHYIYLIIYYKYARQLKAVDFI